MKVPRAPGYEYVFLFGAIWNGLIERGRDGYTTGALCMGVSIVIALSKRMERMARIKDASLALLLGGALVWFMLAYRSASHRL